MSPLSLLDATRPHNDVAVQVATDIVCSDETSSAHQQGVLVEAVRRHSSDLIRFGAFLIGTLAFLTMLAAIYVLIQSNSV